MDERDAGMATPSDGAENAGSKPPPKRPQPGGILDEAEVRALRDFFRGSGGSVFFLLSAVSIFYGLSAIVGPILGTSFALERTLPAIGTIGLYEVSLFGVMLALVLRWRVTRDAVSLFVLVAIFLITLGMLVSTVANDAPVTIVGVGAASVGLAWLQIGLARRWLRIPLPNLALAALALLLAWNGLGAALLAQYIGADVESVRTVRDVWALAAGVPIAGAVLLYLSAAAAHTGRLAKEQAHDVFLRTPGMMWVFAGTILAGTAVHQYAMRYVFDLPFYAVDYVPLIGIASLTAIEVARGFGLRQRWLTIPASAIAPVVLFIAILAESFDTAAGLGAGLLVHPAAMLAGLCALLLWTASRVRRLDLAGMAAVYGVGMLILMRPASAGSGAETLNWDLVWMAAAAFSVPVLLVFRNPTLWILACAVAAVALPQTILFARIFPDQVASGDVNFAWSCALFGGGVVLVYCVFRSRMPQWIAVAGAALLCMAALGLSMHEQPPVPPAVIAVTLLILSGVVYGRTRDALTTAVLGAPFLRLAYVSFADAGAWRFMILGFVLLILGAAWSVRGERIRHRRAATSTVDSQP